MRFDRHFGLAGPKNKFFQLGLLFFDCARAWLAIFRAASQACTRFIERRVNADDIKPFARFRGGKIKSLLQRVLRVTRVIGHENKSA